MVVCRLIQLNLQLKYLILDRFNEDIYTTYFLLVRMPINEQRRKIIVDLIRTMFFLCYEILCLFDSFDINFSFIQFVEQC